MLPAEELKKPQIKMWNTHRDVLLNAYRSYKNALELNGSVHEGYPQRYSQFMKLLECKTSRFALHLKKWFSAERKRNLNHSNWYELEIPSPKYLII
jgi:hypothetical protein